MRGKAGRKDYTLTRDGQMDQALLEDQQTDDAKKQSASIFRLLTLAKEEFCVSHAAYQEVLICFSLLVKACAPCEDSDSLVCAGLSQRCIIVEP